MRPSGQSGAGGSAGLRARPRRRAGRCGWRPARKLSPSRRYSVAELGRAEPHGVCQHGVEYRLKLARRAGDDASTSAVAVCCCSGRSSVRLRSSLSSRVFSMAMTAWAAKFLHQLDLLVGERPYLLAVDGDGADQLSSLSMAPAVACAHRRDRQERSAGITARVSGSVRYVVDMDKPACPAEDDQTRGVGTGNNGRLGDALRAIAGGAFAARRRNSDPPRTATSRQTWRSQMRVASPASSRTPASARRASLMMTCSTSEVAVCCSSASVSFFLQSSMRASYAVAFVPVERRRQRVFGSSPPCETRSPRRPSHWSPSGRSPAKDGGPSILTEPHRELARSFDHLVGAGEQ